MNPNCIDIFITNSPLSFQNTITVSNGLSDFHKMIITVMKMSYIERNISNYESFGTTFIEVFNKHAPLRKKFLRANHAPYIIKTLGKAIMHRSQLETKYLKTKIQTDLKLYKKHKNFCSKLYKRERRKYYVLLDTKNVLVSKEFWKTTKPFLSDKNIVFSQIGIEKNNWILSDDFDLSEEFKQFFRRCC